MQLFSAVATIFSKKNKLILKLADRMRSMRTNGASRNRDYCYTKWLTFSSWANLEKTEVPMVCIST